MVGGGSLIMQCMHLRFHNGSEKVMYTRNVIRNVYEATASRHHWAGSYLLLGLDLSGPY